MCETVKRYASQKGLCSMEFVSQSSRKKCDNEYCYDLYILFLGWKKVNSNTILLRICVFEMKVVITEKERRRKKYITRFLTIRAAIILCV
jgi:hypothetical protein